MSAKPISKGCGGTGRILHSKKKDCAVVHNMVVTVRTCLQTSIVLTTYLPQMDSAQNNRAHSNVMQPLHHPLSYKPCHLICILLQTKLQRHRSLCSLQLWNTVTVQLYLRPAFLLCNNKIALLNIKVTSDQPTPCLPAYLRKSIWIRA